MLFTRFFWLIPPGRNHINKIFLDKSGTFPELSCLCVRMFGERLAPDPGVRDIPERKFVFPGLQARDELLDPCPPLSGRFPHKHPDDLPTQQLVFVRFLSHRKSDADLQSCDARLSAHMVGRQCGLPLTSNAGTCLVPSGSLFHNLGCVIPKLRVNCSDFLPYGDGAHAHTHTDTSSPG